MAFVRSPDLIYIELLQRGAALPLQEPWASMPNSANGDGHRKNIVATALRR